MIIPELYRLGTNSLYYTAYNHRIYFVFVDLIVKHALADGAQAQLEVTGFECTDLGPEPWVSLQCMSLNF